MKIILSVYALFGLAMIVDLLRFHHRYGTRAQRKALEDQLLKDLLYLHSKPFTNAQKIDEQDESKQNPDTLTKEPF